MVLIFVKTLVVIKKISCHHYTHINNSTTRSSLKSFICLKYSWVRGASHIFLPYSGKFFLPYNVQQHQDYLSVILYISLFAPPHNLLLPCHTGFIRNVLPFLQIQTATHCTSSPNGPSIYSTNASEFSWTNRH